MPAQNLDDVLSFVAEMLRKDEKPIHKIADYKTGIHYHEAFLHDVQGLEINSPSQGGAWLRVSRLVKEPPPTFPKLRGNDIAAHHEVVANDKWVTVPEEPDGTPVLKESIRLLLPHQLAREMAKVGRIDRGDFGEPNATGRVSTALRIERFPETAVLYETWLQDAWLPWVERERPRRKAISFYDELFKIHAAITGRDAALEVLIGVGQVRGNIAGFEVDHPLVEYRAELKIDPHTAAISVVSKDDACDIFDFPAEEVAGAAALMGAARQHWGALPDSCDISPFERLHWEPVLQAAASFLGSAGEFQQVSSQRALPTVTTGFKVFDSWVLLVRPSSLRPTLMDIAAMQDELRKATELDPLIVLLDNPSKADGLLQEMIDRVSDLVKSATAQVSVHPSSGGGTGQIAVSVAPYFPKVSNLDQEKIIRVLSKRENKGLVVQGPPGTGKSHSIANILCHALASGWRVLVTAHSDGPLQVLKGMLPPELRNLAINLSSSEQSDVSQLEESVKAIASVATRVDDQAAHVRRIASTEDRIISNRVRLVEIGEAFLGWARENLDYHETYSGRMTAASLAEQIVKESTGNSWFDDEISLLHLVPPLSDADLGRLRLLRAQLREDLIAHTWLLPESIHVPSEDEVVRVHAALVESKRLAEVQPRAAVPHLAGISNGRALAIQLRDKLRNLVGVLGAFQKCPWLVDWFADSLKATEDQRLAPALTEIGGLMAALIAKEADFVLNQVVVPKRPSGMKAAVSKASLSDKPYSKLPFLRPAPDVVEALNAVRVRGQVPVGKGWEIVTEYLDWLGAIEVVAARWNALASMFSLDVVPLDYLAALTCFKQAVANLKTGGQVSTLLGEVDAEAGGLNLQGLQKSEIELGAGRLEATVGYLDGWREALEIRISQIDVAWAAARQTEMLRSLEPYNGPVTEELRLALDDAGSDSKSEAEIGWRWREATKSLSIARQKVALANEVSAGADKLAAAGATKWANRILNEANTSSSSDLANSDPVIPANWMGAWAWAAWKGRLEGSKSLAKVKTLVAEKSAIEEEVHKLMSSVVVLRTELQLSRLPRPLITKLTLFQDAVQRTGAGTGVRAARLRKEAKKLAAQCYDAVPCWIMPLKKVAETQPSKLGMFDLVIIDEASQCGPEAIPVMMRGKKALIVGDDKQVSPTSFMAEEAYAQLHARFLADSPYRSALSPGASMYNLASAMFAGNNIRLREHFRCVEPIIRFSMRFYGDDANTSLVPLRIPKPSERLDPPVIDIYVPHGLAHGKTNPAEALVIAAQIEIIANDPQYEGRTIGVISLNGSEQAALIEREIMNRLGPEVFSRFELIVADSSGFQGKERSIMFLSMVDAPNRRTMARVQDIYAQRYNVALSRARDRMYMVHSVALDSLRNPKDMRRLALQHFIDPMPTEVARRHATEDLLGKCDSGFERDVLLRLLKDGYDANPQFPAAGYKIDIVVEGDEDRRLAIELDGDVYHPPEQYAKDMERQQQLERIGFKFWRCWWSEWILNPDAAYADLIDKLQLLGITPVAGVRKPKSNYAMSYIADESGKLYTAAEYAARFENGKEQGGENASKADYVDAEFSEVAPESNGGSVQTLQLTFTGVRQLVRPVSRLVAGDLVVVQMTDPLGQGECRTRNLELISGDIDRLALGKVAVGSVLGKSLCAASTEDCFEVVIDGVEWALSVVAVRKA